jgi:hypothetical protein
LVLFELLRAAPARRPVRVRTSANATRAVSRRVALLLLGARGTRTGKEESLVISNLL